MFKVINKVSQDKWTRNLKNSEVTVTLIFNPITDMSHSETRLFSNIENFEVHVYNRSATYLRLEKLFGLSTEINNDDEEEDEEDNKNGENTDDKPESPENGKKTR